MFDKPDPKTMFLARYGSTKHIEDAMDKNHPEDTRGAHKDMIMQNPFASKEHLTKLFPHASDLSETGMNWIAKHPNIPDHIKHHIMKSDDKWAIENLYKNSSFKKDDLDNHAKHIDTRSGVEISALTSHPFADEKNNRFNFTKQKSLHENGNFSICTEKFDHSTSCSKSHGRFRFDGSMESNST